ncbi:AraC family transcriptional regulator [Inquilinus sp.]|jgi:AraC-like DNA-binding protein/mannose-6-phosphate isomerase-like protein (cupin superfamily)|uniref:AraC family transcriptional regulator n=1 Tax=Inquilinus sp. TaxID=1932117 RepID=UPI003784E3E5
MIHPDNRVHPDLDRPAAEDYAAPALVFAGEVEAGLHFQSHSHRWAQLFHIVSGSVTVETARGSFVVPPERALWIPPGVPHAVTYLQRSALRYLFLRPEAARHLPPTPSVIRLSPLLRELVLALLGHPRDDAAADGPAGRVLGVILDQLVTEPIAPLHLPMPDSARLRRAVAALAADPARTDGLAEVAGRAALSERSFERHFRAETGLSFRAWRRQARLLKAVEWLSLGASVGEVSDRLGYEGPSAFVAGFRKAFGVTPGRYFTEGG